MKYDKIFVIGFSRTGTTSLHTLFKHCQLRPYHGRNWELEKYDAFSDGLCAKGERSDFEKLYEKYPKSLFILNTRPLKKWLMSRGLHMYMRNKDGFEPENPQTYVNWILQRDKHYLEVLRFFQNDCRRLLVINIEKENWCSIVSKRLIQKELPDVFKNKLNKEVLNPSGVKIIENSINQAFLQLQYSEEQQMSLMVNNPLILLYKNNIR